ncbi:MAG: DegQ family serine endoprotease [Gammaproteobacteria bacterium]|nr:DegQ family serine endoprotease [Gammaproteobacteria bacterium]
MKGNFPASVFKSFTLLAVLLVSSLGASPPASAEDAITSLRQTGKAFASVAKTVSPAVVFVQVEKNTRPAAMQFKRSPFGDDEFFRHFFGPGFRGQRPLQPAPEEHVVGQGTGFIISKDGYILTNNHVVGDADKVTVKLQDGREFDAETIGTDPQSDVAILKIDGSSLPMLKLGDSEALEVGEWVIAIGNPFGLSHTLTVGVVSAKGRSGVGLADYENFIQTDAAINPGNSGGPLVNLNGEVVGMNTAIFSRSGGYMGIGFAIPVNMLIAIKDQLLKDGKVTRGYLGIVIQPLTQDLAESFNLKAQQGILISQVSEDSPAAKAGFQPGDVIVELDGKPVSDVGQFRNQIAMTTPGKTRSVSVLRDGKSKQIKVAVGTLDSEAQSPAPGQPASQTKIGLRVQTLTPDLARQLGTDNTSGVVVSEVEAGSVAALARIEPGSIIRQVNRKPVASAQAFNKMISATPKGSSVLLLIEKDGYARFIALRMP